MALKQRIEIRNFGPIKKVDLDISDYTLFIGPNASGKSTIAKLVYFFQTPIISIDLDQIRNSVKKPVTSVTENAKLHLKEHTEACNEAVGSYIQSQSGLKESWEEAVKSHFQELWDIQALQKDFQVSYCFKFWNEDNWRDGITIKNVNDKLIVAFTDDYIQWIHTLLTKAISHWFGGGAHGMLTSMYEEELPLFSFFSATKSRKKHTQFISAGRYLLSHLADCLHLLDGKFDPLEKEFMLLIERRESDFQESFREVFERIKQSMLKHTEHTPEDVNWGFLQTMELAINLSARILKGEYKDKQIYFNDYSGKQLSVKHFEASSGQQELLWIINLIDLLLAHYTWNYDASNFTIIEEPEAHLYPETQKAVTELISLLANQSGNQVMLTTHSPYILSALNNLLYAHKVAHANEKAKWKEVSEVIPEPLWDNLNINRVAAYVVENGTIRSIIDRDLGIINTEEIDSASRIIANEFDEILKLED